MQEKEERERGWQRWGVQCALKNGAEQRDVCGADLLHCAANTMDLWVGSESLPHPTDLLPVT